MRISSETLANQAEATGFRPDMLEKVALLLQLLDAVRSHPFLKDKLVLKGGTALNLFIFDVPRLSIDIDLNLPLTEAEMEFLDRLLDKGEVNPELLTANEDLQDRIRRHPLLEWKAVSVREYKRDR